MDPISSQVCGSDSPDAPVGFSATPGIDNVGLAWRLPADSNISKWQYRQKAAGDAWGAWTDIAGSGAATRSHTVTGLTTGISYALQVRAAYTGGPGSRSVERMVVPKSSTAAPDTFTATADVGAATLAWTIAPHNDITKWQYRLGSGAWTDIAGSGAATRSHTVTGLASGATYTFRVRAVYGSTSGTASEERTVTAEHARALLDTTMDVGVSGSLAGYSRHGTRSFGSVGGNSFSWGGTDHTLTELLTYQSSVCFRSNPMLTAALLNDLAVTVEDQTYEGGWSIAVGGEACQAKGSLSLTNGETVTVLISTPPGSGQPDAPTGFSATEGDGQATLAWTDPSDSAITKWQYRQKAGSGSYGNWTDVPSSSATTTSYTVTGLTNNTTYAFEVRAFTTAGGPASVMRSATPSSSSAGMALFDATITVGVTNPNTQHELLGYSRHSGRNFGTITETAFSHKGTVHRLIEMLTWQDSFCLRTSPKLVDADIDNGLAVTVDGTTYQGDWTVGSETDGDACIDRGSFQLTSGETVTAVIERPTSGGPKAPAGFRALPGNTSATLSWSGPANDNSITKWQYRYKTTSGGSYGNWTDIPGGAAARLHSVTGLANNTGYTFQLRASYAAMPGSWSVERTATPGLLPEGFTATGGNAQVVLGWTGPSDSGINKWQYRLKTTGGYGNWTDISGGASVRNHIVTGLINDTEYAFQVRAVSGSTNGPQSAEEKATPTASPRNFEVHAGPAMAKLFWDEFAKADSYSVRHRVTSPQGAWTTLTSQTSPVEIKGLSNGTEYDFQVGAVDDGSTTWSSTIKATPNSALPGVPGEHYLRTLTSTTARVHWQDSENDFIAEYRLASASSWTQTHKDNLGSYSHTFSGQTAGEDYLLRIRAKTAEGTSASAGPATDPILVNAAKTPGNLTRTPGDTKITVTWDDVTGASSYSVRYTAVGTIAWTTATDKTSGYEVTGLANGTDYFVQVGAVVGGKTWWSGAGVTGGVKPSLPEGPHSNLAVQPRDGGLYATWTHGNDGKAGQPVANFFYRQGTSGTWTWLSACSTPGNAAPYSEHDCNVTGITNGTVHQVRVSSPGSDWDDLIATATPGPAPSAVTVGVASATSLTVAWTDAPGAASHRLRFRETTAANDGEWSLVGSRTSPVTLSGLTSDTEYDVRVGAVHGTSDGSSTTACDGTDGCGIHWAAVVKATPSNRRLVISEASRTVVEKQGTATWTVALNEAPTGNVTVKVTPRDTAAAKVCTGASCTPSEEITLTFTATTWETAQTVTVTGQNDSAQNPGNRRDAIIDLDTETGNADSVYDNQIGSVAVRVVDDETVLVENSFLSTVMVAGKKVLSGGSTTQTGYVSGQTGFGLVTRDQMAGAASGYSLASFYVDSRVQGSPTIYVKDSSGTEAALPSPLTAQFVLQLGSGSSATRWRANKHSSGNYYVSEAGTNVSFTEGEIYEIHFIVAGPAKPTGFTATAGNASAALAWTGPADNAIEEWQYRYKTSGDYGEWTNIPGSGKDTRDYTVTGLTNGTAHTFQVRAFSTAGSEASDEQSVTPGDSEIWSASLTAGTSGNDVGYVGGQSGLGSLTDTDFTYEGTSYVIDRFYFVGGSSQVEVEFTDDARLPSAAEGRLKVSIGNTEGALTWSTTFSSYVMFGVLFNPFTDGQSHVVSLALAPPTTKPENFTATAGDASATLAWTGPADDAINRWQFRQKAGTGNYGNWSDIASSDKDTRSHTVTGLANGTTYTFQVRAVSRLHGTGGDINGAASNERTATPEPATGKTSLLDTTMTVGRNGNAFGYGNVPGNNFGSLGEDTFTYNGHSYDLTWLIHGPPSVTDIHIITDPLIDLAVLNELTLTWKDKVYAGGWSVVANGDGYGQDRNGLSLSTGDTGVTLKIEVGADKPTGFTAKPTGENGVALAWTGPSGAGIGKWQYRVKAHGGSYGNWTDIPGSDRDTRAHTVDGLASHTPHSFQVRAFAGVGGLASDEKTTRTGGLQTLMSTMITVGLDGTRRGYHFGDSGFGAIDDETVFHQKPGETDYTKFRLSWVYQDGSDRLCIAFNTFINRAADLNDWVVSVKDRRYLGGWVFQNETCQFSHALDGLDLIDGERVAVTLAKPATGEPDAPAGFSASPGDASVALAWNGPADSTVTRWQWRQRTAAGDYGPWFDVPGSGRDTRAYTVTNLSNETAYRFQTRAWSTLPGIPSVELSATPPYALKTTMTVGSGASFRGYRRDGGNYGSIDNNKLIYDRTTYRIDYLIWNISSKEVDIKTTPKLPAAALSAMVFTWKDKTYQGSWTEFDTFHRRPGDPDGNGPRDALSLTNGEIVAVQFGVGVGATSVLLAAPTGLTAEGGDGAATVTWQMPGQGAASGSPGDGTASNAPTSAGGNGVAPGPGSPPSAGTSTTGANAAASGTLTPSSLGVVARNAAAAVAPARSTAGPATPLSADGPGLTAAASGPVSSEYEVAWTREGEDWSAGDAMRVTDLTATIPRLDNGTRYRFRVRAWHGAEPGMSL